MLHHPSTIKYSIFCIDKEYKKGIQTQKHSSDGKTMDQPHGPA